MEWTLQGDVIDASYRKKISDFVLTTNRFTADVQVREFETNFAKFCHSKYCIGVGNGLDALILTLRSYIELGIMSEGDEVIVPSFTFVSSALAFHMHGAKIIFADIKEDTLNIDESKVENLITNRTRAIVVVHYGGVACEMDHLIALSNKYNLDIVENYHLLNQLIFEIIDIWNMVVTYRLT